MRALARAIAVAAYFAIAPSTVPLWRADPTNRVAVVLAVGEPTPRLGVRRAP